MVSIETLHNLGLSKDESAIYLAALELGESLPAHLAEKSGVTRPLLYKLLPGLFEKGILSQTVKGKRRYLNAEDPEKLFEQKRSELKILEESLPELRLLLRIAGVKPKIVFYEGIEGLKRLYMDTLRRKEPILEFVSIEKIHPDIELHSKNYYIPSRINRRIPIKILVSGKTESELLNLKSDPYALREVRTVDEKTFSIPLDCYIYGDAVSFAVYRIDSEPIGIIIRSPEIATTMRSLFSFIWSKAKGAL